MTPKTINYKGYVIPMGKAGKHVKTRMKIINDFYKKWLNGSDEKSVKNTSLGKFIHVDGDSLIETRHHSSKSYQSTLTVLELGYVLKNAILIAKDDPKPGNKSQKRFVKMLLMECIVPKLRPHVITAKLTVGVRRTGRHLQYCLTAK